MLRQAQPRLAGMVGTAPRALRRWCRRPLERRHGLATNVGAATAAGALKRLDPALVGPLLRLQDASMSGSRDLDVDAAVKSLNLWRQSLAVGVVPDNRALTLPREPLLSAWSAALLEIDMPRFTRRHPLLLSLCLSNMLDLATAFELEQQRIKEQNPEEEDDEMGQNDGEIGGSGSGEGGDGENSMPGGDDAEGSEGGDGSDETTDGEAGGSEAGDGREQENSSSDGEQSDGAGGGGEDMDGSEGSAEGGSGGGQGQVSAPDFEQLMKDAAGTEVSVSMDEGEGGGTGDGAMDQERAMAEKMMQDFKSQWAPQLDQVTEAQEMMQQIGATGFDLDPGLWQKQGWLELEKLRPLLEQLKSFELLIKKLGRGGTRGRRRRSLVQRERAGGANRVVQSPLVSEEISENAITRSDHLSRMLPSEAMLACSDNPELFMLHTARRAERTLLSYEFAGWIENPARAARRLASRPSGNGGPIMVCLDTSGSMAGAREALSKALALKCISAAHAKKRPCYLYAFGGAEQLAEIEVGVKRGEGLEPLLDFLCHSFNAGTDVDAPMAQALRRLSHEEWRDADVLLITDGQFKVPAQQLLDELQQAQWELGLEVHGLLVGVEDASEGLRSISTHIHTVQLHSNAPATVRSSAAR